MADRLQTETGVDDLLLENGSDGLTTEATVTAETPTPGGAIGGGRSPSAVVTLVLGGAVATGRAPVVVVTVARGGATAAGNAPTDSAATSETPGRGGATAAGVAPTARVFVFQLGANAGGFPPSAPLFETPGRGAAVAGGRGPTFPTDQIAEFIPSFIHEAGRSQ